MTFIVISQFLSEWVQRETKVCPSINTGIRVSCAVMVILSLQAQNHTTTDFIALCLQGTNLDFQLTLCEIKLGNDLNHAYM